MTSRPARILICTVGTSLFRPNLEGLRKELAEGTIRDDRRPLAQAYRAGDWTAVARELARLPGSERLCGAEVNSVASMVEHGHVAADCGLFFVHSDTDDGRHVAAILTAYFRTRGHTPVEAVPVPDLQDQDPKRFRTAGLRNLARAVCAVIRAHSAAACAVNATGGYKAQIAVAVLLGQALGVPVFYKHELFSEIIAFPPLPVALDFEVWLRAGGLLYDLERNPQPTPADLYAEEWDERYESLVERVRIDGRDYLELSPAGQIFHETFRERFRSARDHILPPPVPAGQKRPPRLEKAGWPGEHPEVERFMSRATAEVPQVAHCATFYYNPDLPERTRFRLGRDGVEGVYSEGNFTVKFRVETSAQTPGQQAAVVAALNEWLARQS
jgi:putative CRISPR-associated protein (TIGR02619 family)